MNVKGRTKYEFVIVIIVIVLAVAVAAGLYAARSKINNGKRVMAELSAIRSAVSVYATVNKALPPNLEVLFNSFDPGNGVSRPFLDNVPKDKDGKLVDPFGRPYSYDNKRGRVSSVSSGYEKW